MPVVRVSPPFWNERERAGVAGCGLRVVGGGGGGSLGLIWRRLWGVVALTLSTDMTSEDAVIPAGEPPLLPPRTQYELGLGLVS